ncbi:hypothetical protein C0J52_04764 [Blattella germanica]|nr:hypothetical protein C0J52_04764 [Blattella germanica]
MFMLAEKSTCGLWLAEHKSMITVQRLFRREYNKDCPHENNIRRWHKQFKETGNVQKGKQEGPEHHKKILKESDSPVFRVLRSPFHADHLKQRIRQG